MQIFMLKFIPKPSGGIDACQDGKIKCPLAYLLVKMTSPLSFPEITLYFYI